MSLILKGIDLPKEDDFIAMEIHKGEYRIYYTKGATIKEKRGEAIQIPKDHGRIGDLDKLYDDIYEADIDEYDPCSFGKIMYMVRTASMILEAESEEQNDMPI